MLGRGAAMSAPQWRGGALDVRGALRSGGNLLFALFVAAVLAFTLLAAVHSPDDPLLHPSSHQLTAFLTSTTSNSTFLADDSVLRTGEDFATAGSNSSEAALSTAAVAEALPFIELSDVGSEKMEAVTTEQSITVDTDDNSAAGGGVAEDKPIVEAVSCDTEAPVDCAGDRDLFNLLMRTAIERFPDLHFYRFGRPVAVPDSTMACDLAWRFRPAEDATGRTTYYKDYRRFTLSRDVSTCSLVVESVGEYHSGTGAKRSGRRKGKKGKKGKRESPTATDFLPTKTRMRLDENAANADTTTAVEPVFVVGEAVNDSLPVVASESEFSRGKYLIYMGGGEKCKSMNHYIWGLLCALGEAQFLNRTLVMDFSVCLNSRYTASGKDENKDFRLYFDFEHLKESASVIDQSQFWTEWGKWHKKDRLKNHYTEDIKVTPMKLRDVKDTLIMRKFGLVEPDNYWSRVCEGETEAMVKRPWHLLWKSRRLMEIVSAIASRMSWDFDSMHIVRGEKAQNTQMWPNLDADTSPENLLVTLNDKVGAGRHLYIATDEPDKSFFDPLKNKYKTHLLDDFKDLWDENSEWYAETKELNNGNPVEFDGYMRVAVDTEVFLRGKRKLETFNDLTHDCKDGVNTCAASS
ncbi:uncharacterized protein LOC100821421 [Brachypodium distachyon]|uniref:Uncharacterized protein n=1 Tax=Brachypodium distachyon TaxID=15368 RepID=I1I4E4_BRADI|nr:uncharacterized protein LOC100821421 [Brachypodium distachyon]KQJ96945.1 hypothetical protein BRADI_3g27870v3 [Brachypodium distachyon]|eukprot:XP_003573997.1 uncharacterized protein LOC100821421 [Brachypodium distachyon]